MGQLTTCLKATKELRKQFKEQDKEPKKLEHQDIQDVIYRNERSFGCNMEAVLAVFSTLLGENLKKKGEDSMACFNKVEGSGLIYNYEGNEGFGDFVLDYNQISELNWGQGRLSMSRRFIHWRPATDSEIRAHFS